MIKKTSRKVLLSQNADLYNDNVKMRSEIENLLAVNTELAIMNEQAKAAIDKANKSIEEYNAKLTDNG